MKIAITGHRPNKLNNDYNLIGPLTQAIRARLIDVIAQYKPTQMISGMALGIDTLWASLALGMRIPLIAAIPFKGQELMWSNYSLTMYYDILELASEIIIVDRNLGLDGHICDPETPFQCYLREQNTPYNKYSMQLRNQWMVNNCDMLVAIWDGSEGGTANCVKYAKTMEVNTLIINPRNHEELIKD